MAVFKGCFCSLCKFCGSLLCQRQIHNIFFVLQIVFDHGSFCCLNLCTCQHNGTIFLQFLDGLIQHILCTVIAVVLRTVSTLVRNKIQGTRFSQLFQDLVSICHARNFHVDPVCALFVNLGLGAVLLHSFL